MTVRPELLFFLLITLLPPYGATDTLPPPLAALRTAHLLPYLLHALPSPVPHYLRTHQYLLMCTLCVLYVHASPHRYLMYHCTFCARFLTLLHVYYHAPYTRSPSISTGHSSPVFCRLDFLSNQVAFPSWFASDTCKG